MYDTYWSVAGWSEPHSVGSVVGGSVVGGSVVGGSVVGGAVVGGSVVGGAVVGGAVVGSEVVGAAVVGSVVCPGGCVCVGAAVVLWVVAVVDLLVAVAVVVGFAAVSDADGSCASLGAEAEGAAVDGTGPAEPLTRTDIDVAGLLGTFAQVVTGAGVRALLAAASTPMRQNAPIPPSRPTRRVLDCAAYQSSTLSAAAFMASWIPRTKVLGACRGVRCGPGRTAAFDAGSPSAARRARCSLTPDPPRSVGHRRRGHPVTSENPKWLA
jgi:hypothetical protein